VIALAPPPVAEVRRSARTEADIVAELQRTVSASRITTFLQCRLKFYFRYVARIAKPKSAALHLGQAVHGALKAWHKARWRGEPLDNEQFRAAFEAAWGDRAEEPIARRDDDEAGQKQMGWRLLETYVRDSQVPEASRPEAVEVPVEADLSRHGLPLLIGIIDLVQDGRIVDYKTSASTPNAATAGHVHEVQTSCYAVLYRAGTGRTEKGIELHHLVKLKTPKFVVTALEPMSERQQGRLFRLVDAYVTGIGRRDFVPSPGLACLGCEYFGECRRWT
jgi:putative RecB family exonuclease